MLVFDEIKTGCRLAVGGAAERFGVHPDLMVLGLAVANGFGRAHSITEYLAHAGVANTIDEALRTGA